MQRKSSPRSKPSPRKRTVSPRSRVSRPTRAVVSPARRKESTAALNPTDHAHQAEAQLALLNAVSQGLASKLDFQGIIDLVGEKIRAIFDAQVVIIALHDPRTNLTSFPYVIGPLDGKFTRIYPDPRPPSGFSGHVIKTRQPLVINRDFEKWREKYGSTLLGGTQHPKSAIVVPILAADQASGTISLQNIDREEAFPEAEVRLLTTLAANLGIAIQNARSFEAERQRAAELAVINSVQQALASKLDMQAIYDLLGAKIREIFDAQVVVIVTFDPVENLIRTNYLSENGKRFYPDPSAPSPFAARLMQSHKSLLVRTRPEFEELGARTTPGTATVKAGIFVPLLVAGELRGGISLQNIDRENAFSDSDVRLLETLASSMSVALENARLFNELQTRHREITEALEQQTATSEILRVIAESPTEVQPVLDVIAENAARVCAANDAHIYRVEGAVLKEWIHFGPIPGLEPGESLPLNRASVIGRAIVDRQFIHIRDAALELNEAEFPVSAALQRRWGYRTSVAVPLLREGVAIGGIAIRRNVVQPFTEKQIALLQTFADQAVIAIENVRLFNELQTRNREITDAFEQQTATSEILRVMASSPTDVQPVMDVIAEHALKLCGGLFCAVYQTDGEMIDQVAQANFSPEALEESRRSYPRPLARDSSVSARAILERTVLNLPDVLNDPSLPDVTHRYARALGLNSLLVVPMLREQDAIGSIGIGRREKGLFDAKHVALMKTFADQAVIAIENVRLFNELQQRNREITEALEYQTAVGEILRVIAGSPTDIQPVLDAISENALKLCGANFSAVYSYDGKTIDMTSLRNFTPQATEEIRREYPRPLTRDAGYSARSILDRQVVEVIDALNDPDVPEATRPLVAKLGFRSGLWVPMLREGNAIGAFCVARPEPGAFDPQKIQLLQTFADQATIAIENVRLFTETQRLLKETEQRAAELEIINSVQQGLASQLDMQAIYDLVGEKIREIFDTQGAGIAIVDRAQNLVMVKYLFEDGHIYRDKSFPLGQGLTSIVLETRRPLLLNSPEDFSPYLDRIIFPGARTNSKSWLTVPILIGGEAIGAMNVQNFEREYAFTTSDVRLLETLLSFA